MNSQGRDNNMKKTYTIKQLKTLTKEWLEDDYFSCSDIDYLARKMVNKYLEWLNDKEFEKEYEFKNDVRNEKAIVLDDDLPDWEADHEDEEGNKHE
jgi:hypothetical protein